MFILGYLAGKDSFRVPLKEARRDQAIIPSNGFVVINSLHSDLVNLKLYVTVVRMLMEGSMLWADLFVLRQGLPM